VSGKQRTTRAWSWVRGMVKGRKARVYLNLDSKVRLPLGSVEKTRSVSLTVHRRGWSEEKLHARTE